MKTATLIEEQNHEETSEVRPAAPRVVYARPPLQLARVLEAAEGGWRITNGDEEVIAELDPSVDPALVQECVDRGARVLVEDGHPMVIVGALATQRALNIDADGAVEAEVESFTVKAQSEVLLRTRASFLRIRGREIESFAGEVVTRARDTVRFLGALIRMN